MSEINPDKRAFDPAIQTENIAFDASEMVACRGCGRANPPNRRKCIYCARELELTTQNAVAIKPALRKLEAWENGFNVVLVASDANTDEERIAKLLSMEPSKITEIIAHDTSLPLARVESEADANVLKNDLETLGAKCVIVADADLNGEKPPTRLSGVEFAGDRLRLKDFNTGKITEFGREELALIVPGIVITGRIESLEKKRRRGKVAKVLDETATGGDESLLDIYSVHDAVGFRIHLAGFDFSGLGEDKGLLAAENMRSLMIGLKEFAPAAKLVSNYASVRHSLEDVWEIESRKDAQGLRRAGFGKVEFGTVASTSNLAQFTKFSRLQWHLL